MRLRVDQACRQFASKGMLPRVDKETAFYVLDRFVEAVKCGRTLRYFAQTEGPWLQWLLIDYWQIAGVHRWRARLDQIQTD